MTSLGLTRAVILALIPYVLQHLGFFLVLVNTLILYFELFIDLLIVRNSVVPLCQCSNPSYFL